MTSTTPSTRSDTLATQGLGRHRGSMALVWPLTLLVLAVAGLGLFLWQRAVNFDEVCLLHVAWLRARGQLNGGEYLFTHPGLLVDLMAPFVGTSPDPLRCLDLSRWTSLGLALAQGLGLYLWTAAATGSSAFALWAPALLLSCDSIGYSIAELRVDASASAWALLGWWALQLKASFAGGVALGLAAADNQKYILLVPFAFVHALRIRGPKSAVRLALAATLPSLALLARAWYAGVLPAYFTFNYLLGAHLSKTSRLTDNLGLIRDLVLSSPHLLVLSIVPVWKGIREFVIGADTSRALLVLAGAGAIVLAGASPYPNQYNLLPLIPVLVLASLLSIEKAFTAKARLTVAIYVTFFHLVLPSIHRWPIWRSEEAGDQRADVLERHRLIPAVEKYFDAAGLAFRDAPGRFLQLTLTVHRQLEARPEFQARIPETLTRHQCRFVALNDFTAPLPDAQRRFLEENYVPLWKDVRVLGRRFTGAELSKGVRFDLPIGAVFVAIGNGHELPAGQLEIDGKPAGKEIELAAGPHHARLARGGTDVELRSIRPSGRSAPEARRTVAPPSSAEKAQP